MLNRIYLFLFLIILSSCKHYAFVSKFDSSVITIDTINTIKEDTSSLRIINPYKVKVEAQMNEVLAYSEQTIIKGSPESLINNFVSDLILKKANEYYKPKDQKKIDLCLLNNGGIRTSLPKGNITLGKLYELMPFENYLVALTITGENTKQMFNYIAKNGGEPISGFTMGMKDTLAINVMIDGKPFDVNKNYKVVTSDYLASGGDKMYFFKNPVSSENIGIKVRDAIIEYVKDENKKGNALKSKLDNRLHYEK